MLRSQLFNRITHWLWKYHPFIYIKKIFLTVDWTEKQIKIDQIKYKYILGILGRSYEGKECAGFISALEELKKLIF